MRLSLRKRGGNCNTRARWYIGRRNSCTYGRFHSAVLSTHFSQRWSKVPINPNTFISSMHYEPILAESEPFKPEIIQFYNQTKGGVDNLDKLVRTYSSIRKCNRWPVTLFFNLTDIAAYNALVCYVFTNPKYHKGKLSRRRFFLEVLAFQLTGKDTHDAPDNLIRLLLQRRIDARNADALIVQEKTIKRHLKFAINAKNRYAKIILKLFVLGAVILIDSKIFSRINIFESKIIFTSNLGQILSFQLLFGL